MHFPIRLFSMVVLLGASVAASSWGSTFTWTGPDAGSWDTTTANWSGAGTHWVNGSANVAAFGGTAVEVNLAESVTANLLVFTAGGYSIERANSSTLTLTLAGAGLEVDTDPSVATVLAVPIAGTAGMVKSGTGLLSLSVASTYTGATSVTGGVLQLTTVTNALPTATDLSISSGASVVLGGIGQQVASLSGAGTVTENSTTSQSELTVGNNTTDDVFTGALLDGGGSDQGLALQKTGSDTLTLQGATANTYRRGATVEAGVLVAGKATAFGTGTGNVRLGATAALVGGITVANDFFLAGGGASGQSGTLQNNSGNNTMAGTLTDLGFGTTIAAKAGSLTLAGSFTVGGNQMLFNPLAGASIIVQAGVLVGTGGLNEEGAGNLVINGAQTLTGAVSLNGTLTLNGALGAISQLEIGNGATLIGSGSTTAQVLLDGTLSADGGTLTLGSLDWSSDGTLAETLGGTATPVVVTGALSPGMGQGAPIALTDGGAIPGHTYTLMTFGSNTGFTTSDFTVTGMTGTLALTATALTFTTTPANYGVVVLAANGKGQVTFTLRNTGNTTTAFNLVATTSVKRNGKGPKPSKSTYKVTYTLNGAAIASSATSGPVPAGATATVVVTVKAKKKLKFTSTVQTSLVATSQADSSVSDSASGKFTLK